jgi:hypothetical protein
MSLYRQAGGRGPRALVAALVAGLLFGALTGFLLGRGSVDDPSAAEAVADVRAELTPAAAGLELVPIEYQGAVRRGEVVASTEYTATQGAAARAAGELGAVAADMRAIDPAGYEAATAAIAHLQAAIDAVAPPARVEALAGRASARLEALAAGS